MVLIENIFSLHLELISSNCQYITTLYILCIFYTFLYYFLINNFIFFKKIFFWYMYFFKFFIFFIYVHIFTHNIFFIFFIIFLRIILLFFLYILDFAVTIIKLPTNFYRNIFHYTVFYFVLFRNLKIFISNHKINLS